MSTSVDGGHLSRLVRDRQARGSRARVGRAAPLPSHPPPASVECPCARGGHAGLLDKGESARKAGRRALAHLDLLRVDKRVLDLAGGLLPFELRTLDAIHLATAQRLGVDLGRLCTYDDRMRDAAKTLGMAVIAPS